MLRFAFYSAIVFAASLPTQAGEHGTTASHSDPHAKAHWSYEGATGPEHWGKMDEANVTCSLGKEQSPVDLKWSKPLAKRELGFSYHSSDLRVIDNGHTIQVNFDKGSTVTIEGHAYDLVQMHFHARSEHTISKKTFPLEAHFVHKDAGGKLAVVGVLFKEGAHNEELDAIWKNFPRTTGEEVKVSDAKIDPSTLLPKQRTHYHYMGSLTTPPCSEGVNWNVMNTPITASKEQLMRFTKLYSANYRPVQPLHNRSPANF